MDHFYLTDPAGGDAPILGYEPEGNVGYVYPSAEPGYIPLFRLYHGGYDDHFYTTSESEAIEATKGGYIREGITCYVTTKPSDSFVPLYRLYNITSGDHYYTSKISDVNIAIRTSGYDLESIACYVSPRGYRSAVPLYRWYKSGLLTNFTFAKSYTSDQKNTILRSHNYIFSLLGNTCQNLTQEEKNRLKSVYRQAIHHDIETNSDLYGSAVVNGRTLYLNLNKLSPLGDTNTQQTLIHEMMHIAGYSHPNRRPCTNDPKTGDCFGDGGPYYGSAPLRAELCTTNFYHGLTAGNKLQLKCVAEEGKCAMVDDVDG